MTSMNNITGDHQALPPEMLIQRTYFMFSSRCGGSEDDRFPYTFMYLNLRNSYEGTTAAPHNTEHYSENSLPWNSAIGLI